ncbi:hypothetical protein HYDPIDRAFT_115875 [Hydnomerulius pinastri MD-312]|uniref:Uncharacterized protein n=1 Tax=Hydnomerulius pinastri MD-312 TaxID=994086 RepID=A0A0C9W4K5_9AGAM|nr:hypothetical protein HYDPIDRAFT_115875 [Hydnomerulius pinastri MD-312]
MFAPWSRHLGRILRVVSTDRPERLPRTPLPQPRRQDLVARHPALPRVSRFTTHLPQGSRRITAFSSRITVGYATTATYRFACHLHRATPTLDSRFGVGACAPESPPPRSGPTPPIFADAAVLGEEPYLMVRRDPALRLIARLSILNPAFELLPTNY